MSAPQAAGVFRASSREYPKMRARKPWMGLLGIARCPAETAPLRSFTDIATLGCGALALALPMLCGSVPARSESSSSTAISPVGAVLTDEPGAAIPTAVGSRNTRLTNALGRGYGIQYWGSGYTAERLAAAPHGLLIIEATKLGATDSVSGREELFSRDEVYQIRREGSRPVLGYINLSEIEIYRDYWVETVRSRTNDAAAGGVDGLAGWIGPRLGPEERLAIYWAPEWEAILVARLERLLALGLDGVFLDDALHYYSYASGEGLDDEGTEHRDDTPKDASGFARAMMGLIERLAAKARALRGDSIIIVNNAVYIGRDAASPESADTEAFGAFERYRNAIDGVLVENMLGPVPQDAAIEVLHKDYARHGVSVLTLDFLSNTDSCLPPDAYRHTIVARAAEAGFLPYVTDDETFNRLYPPISGSAGKLPARSVTSTQ